MLKNKSKSLSEIYTSEIIKCLEFALRFVRKERRDKTRRNMNSGYMHVMEREYSLLFTYILYAWHFPG